MLPVVLHNLIGTYDLIFDININILIVLEYWSFLRIGNLMHFSITKNLTPSNIKNNQAIIIQYS